MGANRDWFDIDDTGIARIRNEAKSIPEVQILLKDKNPEKYWAYIWNICSYKSPYANYPETERGTKVAEDFLKGPCTPDLAKAVLAYRNSIETPSMRLLRAAKASALSVAKYLEDATNSPDADVKEVVDILGKIGKTIESLDKLEEKVQKEITNEDKIRGGGDIRTRER